jgi:hypothetical protein
VKIGHGDVPDGDKEDKASQGDDESTLNVKDYGHHQQQP